jgi:hypothetical protein
MNVGFLTTIFPAITSRHTGRYQSHRAGCNQ